MHARLQGRWTGLRVARDQRAQILGVFFDLIPADPGLVLAAPGVGMGDEPSQLAPTAGGLGQQPQALAAVGAQEEFGADDGVHAGLLCGGVEARYAVDTVAVGQGECRVVEFGSALGEFFGIGSALQE